MSVKNCMYSDKYYPLLVSWMENDPSTFTQKVREVFTNADEVLAKFRSGTEISPTPIIPMEVKDASLKSGIEVSKNADTAQYLYVDAPSRYKMMSNRFIQMMVEAAIYDPQSQNFIDANNLFEDDTYLNTKIVEYKKSLVKIILNYLNDPKFSGINLDELSYKDLEILQENVLNLYKNTIVSEIDNHEVYDAFAILSNFDNLLKSHTPFISINKGYENSGQYTPGRYIYNGPTVKHFTGVMSSNEFMSAEENSSDLAKILLQYFPEISVSGENLNNPISLSGFNSAMTKVIAWARKNPQMKNELKKGANANMSIIIDGYINALNNNNIPYHHRTYLLSKLNGIKTYIYGKLPKDIQQMFTHLILKTVPSNYVEYTISGTDVSSKYLSERSIMIQRSFLTECINSASDYWRDNQYIFEQILSNHNIELTGRPGDYVITIGDAKIHVQDNTVMVDGNINDLESIVESVIQLAISEDTNVVAQTIDKRNNVQSLYAPIIASVIIRTLSDPSFENSFGDLNELARVLSIMHGSEIINVVKNGEGNNLPLYQMLCLAYRHDDIYDHLTEQIENSPSPFHHNIIYQNINNVETPQIRSGILDSKGKFTSSAAMTSNDVMQVAILDDFYANLTTPKKLWDEGEQTIGIIGLQSHVYSDKNKHFIQMFNLNKMWKYTDANDNVKNINIYQVLMDYLNGDTENIDPILEMFWITSKQQIDAIVDGIIFDYFQVFGDEVKTLSDVKSIINRYSENIHELRNKFQESGVNFVEEIHVSKKSFNESIEYLADQFKDLQSFKIFINENFERFKSDAADVIDSITKLSKDSNSKYHGLNVKRLIKAYFITDAFLTNDYNRMMVGQVFAHPSKNKVSKEDLKKELIAKNPYLGKIENAQELERLADTQWKSESYASRWISQVKRMVIYGATYHSYAQGMTYGVADKVKGAFIEDIGSDVFSITGQHGIVDSMDGSGLTSPLLSRMQNASLIDAAVGANKKTIYHDIEGKYGLPTLLKWAEYEITNEKRRNSHTCSLENVYRKMHNLSLSKNINLDLDTDLYFTDQKGRYYKIESIHIHNGLGQQICYEVDSDGNILNLNNQIVFDFNVTSIYDIDQMLGGAWAMTLDNGTLDYTESNLDILTKIVCENDLKGDMIGWLINKSGGKVGVTNLNSVNSWTDNTPFKYVELSTKFGGLQMNADHELDHAEVTEMTQMISALEQMGYSHNVATNVYREIGQVCHNAISKLYNIAYGNDPDKLDQLYQIYGKAVIEAFATGTKDTLGLAQAFCTIAAKSLNDNKLTYRIPFSSSSINGIFNSTVTSQLIKKAIRRHYSGVAAVLNPSFNIIEYYDINGLKYRKEELGNIIKSYLDSKGLSELFDIYSVDDFINEHTLILNGNEIKNPFIKDVIPSEIDFEDTVILYDNENKFIKKFKIDTFEKYDFVKHHCPYNIAIHTLAPKNLKGSNTTFDINGVKHSMFESPYTLMLKYFINAKNAPLDINDLIGYWTDSVTKEYKNLFGYVSEEAINQIVNFRVTILNNLIFEFETKKKVSAMKNLNMFKRFILQKQQAILNNLSENKPISWVDISGNTITVQATNTVVNAAQIGMGKLYAQEFGLRKGDSIAKIKSEGPKFFETRMASHYDHDNYDTHSYDWVLYDGAGNKLFVKLGKVENVSLNPNFWSINGITYYNGDELCSSEGKQFYKYNDSNGNSHDLCIVDNIDSFWELANSKLYHKISRNYTSNNYTMLLDEQFPNVESYNLGSGIIIDKSQINNADVNSVIGRLAEMEYDSHRRWLQSAAKQKYEAFTESLKFVGTRIPCQNMTSFAPVEVVIFSDVTENEIYLPTTITWLEGSDYDIDKTYLLGYTVSKNGTIKFDAEGSPLHQEAALKNKVVKSILDVIINPVNQINLTNPLTIENFEAIAAKSLLGQGAKKMTSYNPASRYMMQIENMVGKNVIGNVATAIKSFFALSNVYNEVFNKIYDAIVSGNEQLAMQLLNKYTFVYNGNRITLANINVDKFYNILESIQNTELRNILAGILNFQDNLDDQSLMLAQCLNIATDNAKELILKKINADTNWVDIYTSGIILGEDITNIGDFMTSDIINDLVSKYNNSAFDSEQSNTKIDFIKKAIIDEKNPEKIRIYEELLRRVNVAEELRILGKILKINQGMPTNFNEFSKYISSIEQYIEQRINHINLTNYKNAIDSFIKLKKELGLSDELSEEERKIPAVKEAMKAIKSSKDIMENNWIYFNLIQFVQDELYANKMDELYETNKVMFNILNTLRLSPHFSEMFTVLGLNSTILSSLSKRNEIEKQVWNRAQHKNNSNKGVIHTKINDDERKILNALIDDSLINTWIKTNIKDSDGNPRKIVWTHDDKSEVVTFDGGFSKYTFLKYVESELIPRLKNNLFTLNGNIIDTRNNMFVKHLTFGKDNDGNTIFRLPYNMSQIDKNPGIQLEYEKILRAFGELRYITLDNGLSVVDIFYLYNLLVHKDKFSRTALTRLFEDLIISEGGENLLVFKFNEWLENVDVNTIVNDVLYDWGAAHSNNTSNSNINSGNLVITPKLAADKTATIKARISNKFIGFGPEDGSTFYYAQQAGVLANTGNYTSQDVIFVSVPGKRGDAQTRKQYQDQTIEEAIKALKAGATLITDSAEYLATSDYNEGERRLAQNLQDLGYHYETITVDGYKIGKWTNPINSEQLTLNFGENEDPERFNTVEESIAVLESPKTILSNEELAIWNEQGITNPKILVASEHTDPAFHTKQILDILNGVTAIEDKWTSKKLSGKDFAGLYIITKHDGLPIRQLLETKIPKLIHFSITTLGGTKYEPGVMKYTDLLDKINEYIKLGLDPNIITVRIDPIIPGVTNFDDVEMVMKRCSEMGITRIKFSVMDAYSGSTNIVDAMRNLGYDFSIYYNTGNGTINGKPTFHAKPDVLNNIATKMLQLSKKYNLKLYTCAEPLAIAGISKEGCLSVKDVNSILGTQFEDKGTANNNYRKECTCFGGKIDALKYDATCASHCIYCYARHGSDSILRYYNEDGSLKHNALTDPYYSKQSTNRSSKIVKYTPKGQAEQTYTIIGTKIFNKEGDEVYSDENSGHRKLIFVELALQEKRAVKVEYRNVTYVVNDRNQIFSTSSNKIVYQNENDGNRRVILERAREEFAKLQNMPKSIDINTISDKTEAFGVVFPKQGKTSQALKSKYQQWQIDNPTGIVAYRVKFPYNTIEEVQLGHIGNPFSENARGANTVQQFYDWLVTGNNFGNEKATDEYRRAIISKLLSTPTDSPILYYTELGRPSHATVLGYLIANKQLLSNQSYPRIEIYQGYWTRKEVEAQTDKVFLFGDNTDDRVNTHYVPSVTQAVIRGLPNTIGIDTKKNRGTSESSYFTDDDFDIFKAQVDEAIQRAIDSGKTIVIPADGIGTGKAALEKRAPKLFAYLQQRLDELKKLNTPDKLPINESANSTTETKPVIKLTKEQESVVNGVVSHIENSIEPILINGKAGTGKTFIVNEILRKLPSIKRVWVGAVSHKASLLLYSKLAEHPGVEYKTVASMTEKTMDLETDEFINYDGAITKGLMSPPKLIIVDEASMISSEDYNLLVDFAKDANIPIIFIGDDGQLPPVEEKKGVSPIFNLKRFNLTERIRQGEDSPILPFADKFWNYSHGSNEFPNIFEGHQMSSKGAVIYVSNEDAISSAVKLFEKAKEVQRTDLGKVITWTNAARKSLNRTIHNRLFNTNIRWNVGETVVFYDTFKNGRKILAENSSEWIVKNISEIENQYFELENYGISIPVQIITLFDGNRTINVPVFPTEEAEKTWNDYWAKVKTEIRESGRKKLFRPLNAILKSFANIDYGYAITCHKSQGSTYDTVIINPDILRSSDKDFVAKWIYTAITRARNVVAIIDHNATTYSDDQVIALNEVIIRAKEGDKSYISNSSNIDNEIEEISVEEDSPSIGFNNETTLNAEQEINEETAEQLIVTDSLHIDSDYIADSTTIYQTTPSKQSKLIEVVRQAKDKGIKGIHVVSQSDLINEDIYTRSANGFVRNGEIYINVDRANDDTVIHEFGHLYLADAKNNNRLAYYKLLDRIKDTPLWKEMRTWAAYANKIGSDFDEEVLATMISDYYKSGFMDYEYSDFVKEALQLVDSAFIDLLNSEILPDLGDTFITNYHFQQKVATWKNKLVSDNILKENCL